MPGQLNHNLGTCKFPSWLKTRPKLKTAGLNCVGQLGKQNQTQQTPNRESHWTTGESRNKELGCSSTDLTSFNLAYTAYSKMDWNLKNSQFAVFAVLGILANTESVNTKLRIREQFPVWFSSHSHQLTTSKPHFCVFLFKDPLLDWKYNSSVGHLPSMHEALPSIHSTQ